jgi:ABC-type branched-subunit amino acid transport system permease subunit
VSAEASVVRTAVSRGLGSLHRVRWLPEVLALGLVVGLAMVATVSDVWPFVLAGVTDGAIYALAGLGLVLTFKTSGIFNFAIGAQAAASAYVFHSLRDEAGIPWPLAALLVIVLVGMGGSILLERLALHLSDSPAVMKVVATVGLIVLLQSLLTAVYGGTPIPFAPFLPTASFQVGSINIQASQVITAVLAVVATAGLTTFFRRARLGIAMQAVVDDPRLLSLEGTSPDAVRRAAWAIGSSFVSISGMLVAPQLGIDVNVMLVVFTAAFGAAALAGFSSLTGTLVAAVCIGVTSNVMSSQLASSSSEVLSALYTQVPFIALVLAMVSLPRSRFSTSGLAKPRRLSAPAPIPRGALIPLGTVGCCLLASVPFLVGNAYVNPYTSGLTFAIILGSLGLLVWTSGQISLCQMAFAAVGATTSAHAQSAGLPWILAIASGAAAALLVGALVAIPSFRLSGIYLAVATFGAGLLFQNLLYRTGLMFGGAQSLAVPRPQFARGDRAYYYLVLVFAAAVAVAIVTVRRSRLGRLMRGLGDSPLALDAHGTDTRIVRLYVFCISAVIASIGGSLLASVTQSVNGGLAGPFGYFRSVVLIAVLTFCGRRPLVSPLLAAMALAVSPLYPPFNTDFALSYQGVFFGLAAITVAVAPGLPRITGSIRSQERATSLSRARQRVLTIGARP